MDFHETGTYSNSLITSIGASHNSQPRTMHLCCLATCCCTEAIYRHATAAGSDTNGHEVVQARFDRHHLHLPSIFHHHLTIPTRKERPRLEHTANHHVDDEVSISNTSDSNESIDAKRNGSQSSHTDVEMALYEVEHICLRVRGMDCTGCESKLRRALNSLAGLSNVTTSLLLAQAEFDLLPSKYVNSEKIGRIVERMTGFVCSKISREGVELELVFENASNLTDNVLPGGVTGLTPLARNRVLVTYKPNIIGARELLSDESFRYAKLAPLSRNNQLVSGRHQLRRTCWKTLLSVLCTLPVLVLAWAKLPEHQELYGAISLGFATVIQVAVAGQFYIRALNSLVFSRMIDMDLLIVISSSAAYVYSVVSYIYLALGDPLSIGEYFETSSLLVTLIMVGRMATEFARQRAMESITIQSLQSTTAILVDPDSEKESEIDARLLQHHDLFKVLPDSSVATDGVVMSGKSEVDESMVTGEANLVSKNPGKPVIAGSVNYSGAFIARVTRVPGENTISVIGTLVDEVKASKTDIQDLADRVASYFAPAILGLSAIVFIAWVIVGQALWHQSAAVASVNAMTFSISVLIVSCPCAIGLAVPMVVVIAGGVAARHGLIFKTANTIDLARNITHVVFDKTGTLTLGKLYVTSEVYPLDNRDSTMSMVLALTAHSIHPVSKAIANHLYSLGIKSSTVHNLESIPGSGVEGSWNGFQVRAGNPYWLSIKDDPEVQRLLRLGLTIFCVTLNGELVALFGLQDLLRQDALDTISELKKRSIDISILSGDNGPTVAKIADELGIPISNTRACYSPQEKQAYVKSLLEPENTHEHGQCDHSHQQRRTYHNTGSSKPTVLFVGDGSNDAPSLAMASIGLHIGDDSTSPTVASSASDIVLLRPSLSKIITLIDLSKAFHTRVLFNFTWSAIYNLTAILLAAGVLPKARIPPGYAGLGEAVSIFPVLGVAISLRFWTG